MHFALRQESQEAKNAKKKELIISFLGALGTLAFLALEKGALAIALISATCAERFLMHDAFGQPKEHVFEADLFGGDAVDGNALRHEQFDDEGMVLVGVFQRENQLIARFFDFRNTRIFA